MRGKGHRRCAWGLLIVMLGSAAVTWGQAVRTQNARARLPEFDPTQTANIFFDDVFAKVVGERPDKLSSQAAATAASASPGTSAAPAAPGTGWSQLISATTIENEIKSIKQALDKNVTTPSDFAGRGHKLVRRDLSLLAMLFAIIHEYDGEVRFKNGAAIVRDVFGRTAANTKAGGNAQVYAEAKLRKGELEDLLGGNAPVGTASDGPPEWGTIADRSPLMQRLELGFDTKLNPLLANQREFAKSKEDVKHEAEMIAAISAVLTKEGMGDADDETYVEFARQMQQAAQDISAAVKLDSYEKARESAGAISKACASCHESYRG